MCITATCPPARAPLARCAAMTRVAGALTKSGEVMKLVNSLMRVPQLSRTMAEMSRGKGRQGGSAAGGFHCVPSTY